MKRFILWGLALIVIGGGAAGYLVYQNIAGKFVSLTPENIQKLEAESAAQNETVFAQPAPQPGQTTSRNPDKNLYFGDLHIHTARSFDSYIFGNRNTLDDAYRFAKGAPLKTIAGEVMQLSRPLDFIAITDHAETFGLFERCAQSGLSEAMEEVCMKMDNPDVGFFLSLRDMGMNRPLKRPDFLCGGSTPEECDAEAQKMARLTWNDMKAAAEKHYEPGVFTTFAGYEYSPTMPKRGKHHRNIFYRNMNTADDAYSAFDAASAPELWRKLEETCTGDCDFITIPHNLNKTWGLAFALNTIDGDPYTKEDWERRAKYEPLVEMHQIKGSSECVMGFGSTDEECGFEQFFPACEKADANKYEAEECITRHSMARGGLKVGLALEKELGFNPLEVGFVGSTDQHNSTPGDTEEYDYRGPNGVFASPAAKRLEARALRGQVKNNPGGLAAVWATENTRDALFDSMKAKEAYATSGTRMRVRLFASDQYDPDMLNSGDMISQAYAKGVPMGSKLTGAKAPSFLIWAGQDPMTVPLDRVQIIKGWVKDGERLETVLDVACSDGRAPDASGRCAKLDAPVDLSNCTPSQNKGAEELKVLWTDPDYDPSVTAFYYVRVMEIPTCRHSTYDALRLGQDPLEGVPTTVQDRAWSSPIWVKG